MAVIWWSAFEDPALTSTLHFIASKSDELSENIAVVPTPTLKDASYFAVLSSPEFWPGTKYRYSPFPRAVVPNPTIFDLIFISSLVLFS